MNVAFPKKTVAVSAVGLRKGGTLRILQQTLEYLSGRADVHTIALVHDRRLCEFPGIEYIEIPWATRSWAHRLWCEYVTMHRISKEIAARPCCAGPAAASPVAGPVAGAAAPDTVAGPVASAAAHGTVAGPVASAAGAGTVAGPVDLWLSLHDTTPRVVAKAQEVYCHTSFPFLKLRLRDFAMDPKIPAFRLLTPLYYRIGARKNASIIVQQEWFADALSRLMRVPRDRFRVIPPVSSVPASPVPASSVPAGVAVPTPAVAGSGVAVADGKGDDAAAAGVAPAVAGPGVAVADGKGDDADAAGAVGAGGVAAGAGAGAAAAPLGPAKVFFDPESPRELAARIAELVAAGARSFFYASTPDCHKNFETLLEAVRIFNSVNTAAASTFPDAGTEMPSSVPGVLEKPGAGTETPSSVPGATEKLVAGTETASSVPGVLENLVAGTETPSIVPGALEKPGVGTEMPSSVPGPSIERSEANLSEPAEDGKDAEDGKEQSAVYFTITVRGDENRYARWLHKRWGSLPNVDFHGLMARDELYEYYRSADVFVFPSRVETWGLPISEYASAHPSGTLLLADLPYARGH